MVIFDSTILMLLLHPGAGVPLDPATGAPLEKAVERVELLLRNLSDAGIPVMVPTPVLSEILVVSTPQAQVKLLAEITSAYAFRIQPFDTMAAVEVAAMCAQDLVRPTISNESKAKVKYDRQIIATARVNGVKTIYSDDGGLARKAAQSGITVIHTWDLPAPPEPPQAELPLEHWVDGEPVTPVVPPAPLSTGGAGE